MLKIEFHHFYKQFSISTFNAKHFPSDNHSIIYFGIKINFRKHESWCIFNPVSRNSFSTFFLLNKHAYSTACIYSVEKLHGEVKLRQFFLSTFAKLNNNSVENFFLEDENSAKWKYWKMHFAQKWWTGKSGKARLLLKIDKRKRILRNC